MRLRYLPSILALWQPLVALVTPQHDAQSPMQLERQQTRESAFDYVIFAFTKENDPKIYSAEVPLGVRIPSGTEDLRTEVAAGDIY